MKVAGFSLKDWKSHTITHSFIPSWYHYYPSEPVYATAMCVIMRLLFNICYLFEMELRVVQQRTEREREREWWAESRFHDHIFQFICSILHYTLPLPLVLAISRRKIKLFEYHCACNIAVFVYLHLSCCSLFLSCILDFFTSSFSCFFLLLIF